MLSRYSRHPEGAPNLRGRNESNSQGLQNAGSVSKMSKGIIFPLQSITKADYQNLNQTLWSWKPCFICSAGIEKCNNTDCPWPGLHRFSSFHKFYATTASHYIPIISRGTEPALRTHDDLLDVIATLKKWPAVPDLF